MGTTSFVFIDFFNCYSRFSNLTLQRYRKALGINRNNTLPNKQITAPSTDRKPQQGKLLVSAYSEVYHMHREQGVAPYTPVTQYEINNVLARNVEYTQENDELISSIIQKVHENHMDEIKQEDVIDYSKVNENMIERGELIFPEENKHSPSSSKHRSSRSRLNQSRSNSSERSRSRSRSYSKYKEEDHHHHHHSQSQSKSYSRGNSHDYSHSKSRRNHSCMN